MQGRNLLVVASTALLICLLQITPAAGQAVYTPAPSHIQLFPVNLVLPAGTSEQFEAARVLRNGGPLGSLLSNALFQTDSADVTILANGGGLFTLAAASITPAGTYHISASINGGQSYRLVALVTVPQGTLTSISVNPSSLTVTQGAPGQQLHAFFNGGTVDVTDSAAWSSDTPGVAMVSSGFLGHGFVNFGGPGTAMITATIGSVSASVPVTVNAPVLQTITVTPNPATIPLAGAVQFHANAKYNNGASADVTASAAWTAVNCNPANAVTIATAPAPNPGAATGNALGTCTVNATMNAIVGSASVQVAGLTPQGEVLYVAGGGTLSPLNPLPGTVTAYNINLNSGALSPLGSTLQTGGLVADWIALHPSGHFAYVVNAATALTNLTGFITEYSIDPNTGALSSPQKFATDMLPESMAIEPTGNFAYVANVLSLTGTSNGSITAYTINQSTGALSPINGTVANSSVATGLSPASVTVGSDGGGSVVYVTNTNSNDISGYTIGGNGALTPILGSPFPALTVGPTASKPPSIAVDPAAGAFLAFVAENRNSEITSYLISTTTPSGALTPAISNSLTASSFATDGRPVSATVDPAGLFLYVANADSTHHDVDTFSIDASTGALTQVGGALAAGATPASVRVDPLRRFVYVANNGSNDVSGYAIQADGSLVSVGPNQANAGGPTALAVGSVPGSPTVITTLDSAVSSQPAVAIGASGLPMISYLGTINNDTRFVLKGVHCTSADCSSFNAPLVLDATLNAGNYSSVAIGTDGNPVISYQGKSGANGVLNVLHCRVADCSAADPPVTVDATPGAGATTKVAIGTDGFPVIAYQTFPALGAGADSLDLVHCTAVDCKSHETPVFLDSTITNGNPSIFMAIGRDHFPLIGYAVGGGPFSFPALKAVHCGSANCGGTNNSIFTLDATPNPAGGLGDFTSGAIGSDGDPVISYMGFSNNKAEVNVVHCGMPDCSAQNSIVTLAPNVNGFYFFSVAIESDGNPLVSYDASLTNGFFLVAVHCTSKDCSSHEAPVQVDSVFNLAKGIIGSGTAVAIGPIDHLPLIVYGGVNATNQILKAVHCGNIHCK